MSVPRSLNKTSRQGCDPRVASASDRLPSRGIHAGTADEYTFHW